MSELVIKEFYCVRLLPEDLARLQAGEEVRKELLSDPGEPELFVELYTKPRQNHRPTPEVRRVTAGGEVEET